MMQLQNSSKIVTVGYLVMTGEEKRIEQLEKDIDSLKGDFKKYVEKKQIEESQKLRTALLLAGGIILALGSFIWLEVIWPVIKVGRG